ncbi:MAG: hypothetical protein FWC89_06980 [Defluviitaleaceae bacterium]|nr:hypothetical protein [Defluviitaleaceae bacterium]
MGVVMEVPAEQMIRVSEILDDWGNADLGDKREVVDNLIIKVSAVSENIEIQWKFQVKDREKAIRILLLPIVAYGSEKVLPQGLKSFELKNLLTLTLNKF